MGGVEIGTTAQRWYLVTRVLAVVALLLLGTFGNAANAARSDDQAGSKPDKGDAVTNNNDIAPAGGKIRKMRRKK